MKKSKFLPFSLVIIIAAIVFGGCYSSSSTLGDYIADEVIQINSPDNGALLKLSDYCKSARIIPLQTSSDCLLGEIQKIEINEDNVYVQDDRKDGILCFDIKGRFKMRIGRKGSGPKDVVDLMSFALNPEEGLLYIYSRANKKVSIYQEDGTFVKAATSTYYARVVDYFENKLYLSSINNGASLPYNLISEDLSGRVLEQYIPECEDCISYRPILRKTKEYLYFYPNTMTDIIYSVRNGEFKAAFQVDCGRHTIPEAIWERMNNRYTSNNLTDGMEIIKNGYIIFHQFAVFRNLVYLSYGFRGQVYSGFYDRQKKTFISTYNVNDDVSFLSFDTPISQTDSKMITVFDAKRLTHMLSLYQQDLYLKDVNLSKAQANVAIKKIQSLIAQTGEDPNPILIIYDVK